MADNDNTLSSSEILLTASRRTRCDPTLRDLGRKFEAAWAEERPAWEACRSDTSDLPDDRNTVWLRAQMLQGRTGQIVRRILERKATTLEELRIKARAALWTRCGELDYGEGIDMEAVKSIIEDLLAASD